LRVLGVVEGGLGVMRVAAGRREAGCSAFE
jgi:hypothetical protein